MEPADPIQQLLKNTGWSCDELLQRLQKLKSSGSETDQNQKPTTQNYFSSRKVSIFKDDLTQIESTPQIETSPQNELIATPEPESTSQNVSTSQTQNNALSEIESTSQNIQKESTSKIDSMLVNFLKSQNDPTLQKKTIRKESSLLPKGPIPMLKLVENKEKSSFQHVFESAITNANRNLYKTTTTTATTASTVLSGGTKEMDETFSDTDEEELEVNATNSSIINEIIDDICTLDNSKSRSQISPELPILEKLNYPSDKNEVTEVRVIEVNEEQKINKTSNPSHFETVTIETDPSENEIKDDNNPNIKYVEIHPRKKFKLVEKSLTSELKERTLPSNITLFKKVPTSPRALISPQSSPTVVKVNKPAVSPNTFGYILKKKQGASNKSLVQIRKLKKILPSTHSLQLSLADGIEKKLVNEFVLRTGEENKIKKDIIIKSEQQSPGKFEEKKLVNEFVLRTGEENKIIKPEQQNVVIAMQKVPNRFYPSKLITKNTSLILTRPEKKLYLSNIKEVSEPPTKISRTLPVVIKSSSPIAKKIQIPEANLIEQPKIESILKKSLPEKLVSENEDSDDDNRSMEYHSNETPTLDTLEDLRNNLKLQLDSLRNRKKNTFLTTPSTNLIDDMECSKKLSLLKEKISQNKVEEEKCLNENDLYTQTNELGLVILNVQGGVEIDDPETITKHESKNNTEESEDIGVFDQIRKIINKQKSTVTKKLSDELTSKNVSTLSDEDKKMDISGDNSQSSEIEEKSPFISDTLDEFLNASKLNISYNVPKLGAEDGLQKFEEERMKNIVAQPLILKRVKTIKVSRDGNMKTPNVIKAKTVAQKRRMLERERKKELRKLERKERKELKLKIKQKGLKIEKNNTPDIHFEGKSYVLFKDNKLWVNSYSTNKCLARIDCCKQEKILTPKSAQKKKLSLLYSKRKEENKIRYRAGPLCKKEHLQVSGSEKWDSHLLKLPKISLEVIPEPKKIFPNEVLHRFNSILGGNLDTNKIEFALSMIQIKTENKIKPESFQFLLPFHNKIENILVRRKKSPSVKTEINKIEKPVEIKISKNPVADVIEDLIRYVEIKELAPTLIKEDDTQLKVEAKLDKLLSPITDNNVSVFKKPQRKRSKIEYELLRLNCKVVNVEVEETEMLKCNKPYCELGCVCKSLKCDYIASHHCQKVDCMFTCTCPAEKPCVYNKLTLPAGTNILSEDAVTRIEDEAKKNLAKVEREFTQTVIHTNDKTIVVGIGSRTKTRRNAKIPVKFTDYIPSNEALCEEEKLSSNCSVNLAKLNLSDIIPYCLIHNLHDCHCKGQALWTPKPKTEIDNDSLKEPSMSIYRQTNLRPKAQKKYNFDTEEKNYTTEVDIKPKKVKLVKKSKMVETNDSSSPLQRSARTIKKRTFSEDFIDYFGHMDCQRVKPIPANFLKAYKYSPEIFKNDFIYNITDSDLFQIRVQSNAQTEVTEAELLKQVLVQERMSDQLKQTQSRNKRKQTLTSRSEHFLPPLPKLLVENKILNENLAIQRRKKVPRNSTEIDPVFDGEIIIDEQNLELLKKIGAKTVAEGYARLLPWLALMNSFHNNTINIWSMIDQPARLLINKSDKSCPINYVNIRETTQKTEVIMWILNNKLPSHYHEDSLSFILKETKEHFEICGICTKNITENLEEKRNEPKVRICNEIKDNNIIFYHKDLHGVERRLILSKENNFDICHLEMMMDTSEVKNSVWARLPDIFDIYKWRMVFLYSDFAYLVFKNIQYSIRYTDLLAVSEYAKEHNCTVSLKNPEFEKSYDHASFGIYFDGKFSDRLFIGPYFKNNNLKNDIETLRFINKTLVSTKNFNKMRGKGDYKCGYWLEQSGKKNIPKSDNTIDLTVENENMFNKTPSNGIGGSNYSPIVYKDQEINIIDAPSRKPEDFNRYIITNIPHFGYLGAFRHPTGEIDVSWPFENKMLRFVNENLATSFLQDRFSTLLQPVPATFKITTIVAIKIDLEIYKPIDSNVLNGHYICGEFGYYDVLLLNDKECRERTKFPKDDILKLFAKRTQDFVRKKIEDLADILNVSKNKSGGYDLPNILNKAQEEISSLVKTERQYIQIKNQMYLKKREKALEIHKILSSLPREQRNIENLKFRAIIHKTEPIEIHDSDEELNKSDNKNKVFKIPSPVTLPKRPILKSVLKPLVPVSALRGGLLPSTSKLIPDKQVLKGVKLVKTPTGLALWRSGSKNQDNKKVVLTNTKIIIQNNEVKQVTDPVSNPSNVSLLKMKNNPELDVYNIDDIIDLDTDDNTGKVTELHIVGDKVVKKMKENVKISDGIDSTIKVSEVFIKDINHLKRIDTNCDKNIVEMEEEKTSQEHVINLDESEDSDEIDKLNNEKPLSPEFVDLEDIESDEIDYSKDMDISIESEEMNKNLNSSAVLIDNNKSEHIVENSEDDVVYIS